MFFQNRVFQNEIFPTWIVQIEPSKLNLQNWKSEKDVQDLVFKIELATLTFGNWCFSAFPTNEKRNREKRVHKKNEYSKSDFQGWIFEIEVSENIFQSWIYQNEIFPKWIVKTESSKSNLQNWIFDEEFSRFDV